MWYNNSVKRRGERNVLGKALPKWNTVCREWKFPPCKARKNFSKTFEKPLDKSTKVWYNMYVRLRDLQNKILIKNRSCYYG